MSEQGGDCLRDFPHPGPLPEGEGVKGGSIRINGDRKEQGSAVKHADSFQSPLPSGEG